MPHPNLKKLRQKFSAWLRSASLRSPIFDKNNNLYFLPRLSLRLASSFRITLRKFGVRVTPPPLAGENVQNFEIFRKICKKVLKFAKFWYFLKNFEKKYENCKKILRFWCQVGYRVTSPPPPLGRGPGPCTQPDPYYMFYL